MHSNIAVSQSQRAIYAEIRTNAGATGLSDAIDGYQAFFIQRYLRPFLTGRDPLAMV